MTWTSIFRGKSGFAAASTAEDVTEGVDGTCLTAIVTGATSGIGLETTRVLALRGIHVIMPVRNLNSGNEVKDNIVKEIPNAKLDVMELDISSQQSVRKFASEYCSKGHPLNILILNAGIMSMPPFCLSKDRIELQFATNYLGNFLLTNLLLDTMKTSAKEGGKEGRIVILSSDNHRNTYREGIRFDKINDENSYCALSAYGQSKLANALHAKELTRRFWKEGVNITANCVHPGFLATNLITCHDGLNAVFDGIVSRFLKNIQQGAATTCYVALHRQVNGISGQYFADSNLSKASKHAQDAELAKKLWKFSLRLTRRNPVVKFLDISTFHVTYSPLYFYIMLFVVTVVLNLLCNPSSFFFLFFLNGWNWNFRLSFM